jgi:putative flippase GtrA
MRYLFVGGTAFIVDFGLLALLVEVANISVSIAIIPAFIAGLLVNYLLSIRWVFASRNVSNRRVEFVIFASIGAFGLLINELSIWSIHFGLGYHWAYSKIVATILVLVWNFGMRKVILFR